MDTPGTYYFGFDSKAYDQNIYTPQVEVTVTYPRCGDGVLEDGEACDDGNANSDDGCTNLCRAELIDTGLPIVPELEPNNYYVTANVLRLAPDETMVVKGNIGAGCDLDFYLVDVPEAGFVNVTMLDGNGQDCAAGTPAFVLEFDDPTGNVELGDGVIAGTNGCPAWDQATFGIQSLPAGQYIIEMKPFNKGVGIDAFDYQLRVELLSAASAQAGSK